MNYSTFYTVFEFWLSADEWMQSFRILVLSIRISVIMELPVVTDFNNIPIEVENHTLC